MAIFLPSFQLLFPWDVIEEHNTHNLMMLFSFLGVPARPLAHRVVPSPTAQGLPQHIPGPDPKDMETLCIRGQSIPCHARHKGSRAQGGGWLQGPAVGAALPQPCAHPRGQQPREQCLPGTASLAEGCKYTPPSRGCSWPCQAGRNGWARRSSQGCWDTAKGSPCSAWGTGYHCKPLRLGDPICRDREEPWGVSRDQGLMCRHRGV